MRDFRYDEVIVVANRGTSIAEASHCCEAGQQDDRISIA